MYQNPTENALAGSSLRALSQAISRYFSPTFEHTRVVALSVDPFTIHVYWHISRKDRVAALFQSNSQVSLVLRFQRISNAGEAAAVVTNGVFEISVKATDHNHYVQLQQDGQCYIVELGIKSLTDNTFKSLAKSTPTTTPSAHSAKEDQAVIFIDHRRTDDIPTQQIMPAIIVQSLYHQQPVTEIPPQTQPSTPAWSGVFAETN